MRSLALLAALAALVLAQENPGTGRYVNKDLGIDFTGVYGWETSFAEGSGAWTELARYSDAGLDASVVLLVRDNPFETSDDLRKALAEEFKEGGDPSAAGQSAFKEVTIKDADMKRGNQLPGFEVEAFTVRVSEEGKKREHKVVVRTYFGTNRLFRVSCMAARARAKRVRDLFERAASGLVVTGSDERVLRGVPFVSVRGRYSCLVPEGYTPNLPAPSWKMDMRFASRRVAINAYSYVFDGVLADHVEELTDFYGDTIKFESEETSVLGGTGFRATVEKDDRVTLIAGVFLHGRIFRVHTSAAKGDLEEAKRAHAGFLEGFKAQK